MQKKHKVTPLVRNAIHPGEILLEEFLVPMKISQSQLAREIGIAQNVVNEICREKRGISARMALILSERFGTSPEYWLRLQLNRELWDAWKIRYQTETTGRELTTRVRSNRRKVTPRRKLAAPQNRKKYAPKRKGISSARKVAPKR